MKRYLRKWRNKSLSVFLIGCLLFLTVNAQPQKKAGNSQNPAFSPNKRQALVIGNSEYDSRPLANPVNDAEIIGESLDAVGFETVVEKNLALAEMKAAIQNFVKRLPAGSVGLFYFAGHGVQIGGRNFLIPVDFNAAESDVAKQAIELDWVIGAMAGKSGLNILILDACRNAPPGLSASDKQGLAEIRSAPAGTFIAFATAPGKTAADGDGDNSPYSESLAENLRLRPSRLEDVFIRTRIQMDYKTRGRQTPWENSSIRTIFYFTEDAFSKTPTAPVSQQRVEQSGAGRFFTVPFSVPVLNESGGQIKLLKQNASYFVETEINLEMAQIRGGRFLMGTSAEEIEQAYKNAKDLRDELTQETVAAEMPQHAVNIDGFFMSKHEITQAQWQAVMGKPPANIPAEFRGANLPVTNVSWRDANNFCQKLSLTTGKNYRLPTEAEWEYAARAGTTTPFAFGKTINSNLANFMATVPFLAAAKGDYRKALIPVGSLKALNGFGLADMHGNVWEWTADNWHDDYNDAPTDGGAWENDDEDYRLYRVIRGGSWDTPGNNCRSAHRRKQPQITGSAKIGFRVAMSN